MHSPLPLLNYASALMLAMMPQRALIRRLIYRRGAEGRIAAAEAKRERKNAKRAADVAKQQQHN